MLKLVPTIQTKYSQIELCAALIGAWEELLGTTPSKAAIGIIVAQHGIETGGGNFAWNNNLGNVKAVDIPGQVVEYMALRGVWEIVNGIRVEIPADKPGAWFRSFHDLHAGAKFHLDLLRNHRYKTSWPAIERGDLVGFATTLRNQGYYTAPLKDYVAGMTRYFNPYMKSTDYEHALASLDPGNAPPLQPWVTIDPEPAPVGELIVTNSSEDAKNVPQEDIESKGSAVALALQNFAGTVASWLKPKS
jgi:hypothetical protein